MDSVIKPLVKKVALFNKDLTRTREGLVKGDPQAVSDIHQLASDIAKLYQDCLSAFTQTKVAMEGSLKTFTITPGGTVTLPSVIYWVKEILPAINLVIEVIKLLTNLFSVSTLLQLVMTEVTKAYNYCRTQTIWLNRAIERSKQKLSKNIEWQRRTIAATINIVYLKGQKKQYETVLSQLSAKLPAKPAPQMGINGYYSGGTFIYYDKPLNTNIINAANLSIGSYKPGTLNTTMSSNAQNTAVNAAGSIYAKVTESQITNITNRLDEIKTQLVKEKLELTSGIKTDKKFWHDKWTKEEADDKKLLQDIKKKLSI